MVIITVALTGGIHTKSANPNLPEQPAEIAQAAYECYNEGAAIVHIHARDPQGKPAGDPEIYSEIHRLIREKCNLILADTTGGGPNLSLEERNKCLDANPEPEMVSLNMGTLLRTSGSYKNIPFLNTRESIEYMAREALKRNIKPEMEIYHHGMFREVQNLIAQGLVKKPYYVNFVLGVAYQGALDATPKYLNSLIDFLPPETLFNVTAIGRAQLHLTTMAMLLGGMVRVGMEDNIYYRKGELAKSNAQLVGRTVRLARELEIEVASPDEARTILGLK
jgi:3-keto-5-aminohexanoate cleavage enzyme